MKKNKKVCRRGHTFYKSSDCPVCPICMNTIEKTKMTGELPSSLSSPALRALHGAKIKTLKKLATFSEQEILALHGVGPSALPKLRQALKEAGLAFRKEKIKSEKVEKSGLKRPKQPMPAFVKKALEEQGLKEAYQARPPYQRNDYLGWINKAALEETKQKRLKIMLTELRKGRGYMGLEWRPRSK